MVAVPPRPAHLERQVDLGRNPYADADRAGRQRGSHGLRLSLLPGRGPSPLSTPGLLSASAIRAKSRHRQAARRESAGRARLRRRPRSAAADDPASPASAERSILRRWAKAASTTANTCSRVAVVGRARPGGGWRPAPTRRWAPARTPWPAPSRPGRPRRTRPSSPTARRRSSSPAGRPAGRRPRPAPSPVRGDQLSKRASRCSSTGTATLYGRLATTAVGGHRQRRRAAARRRRPPCSASARSGSPVGHGTRQLGAEPLVDLHRDHPVGHRQQTEGQRAQPGADLQHDVVRVRPRRRRRSAGPCWRR